MTQLLPLALRLESDAALPGSIETIADTLPPFCDISGFGELTWVRLAADDSANTRYLKGPLQLLSLNGRLRNAGEMALIDIVCTLSRQTDNGIQVLGKRLVDAQVVFAELMFTPLAILDAVEKPSVKLKAASPAIISKPKPIPRPVENLSESRWANAVKEASRIQRDSDIFSDEGRDLRPTRGDIVNHLQFGECTVTRIGDDHITLRKPDGRNVQLGLQILRFTHQGKKDGKDIFQVEVNRKR